MGSAMIPNASLPFEVTKPLFTVKISRTICKSSAPSDAASVTQIPQCAWIFLSRFSKSAKSFPVRAHIRLEPGDHHHRSFCIGGGMLQVRSILHVRCNPLLGTLPGDTLSIGWRNCWNSCFTLSSQFEAGMETCFFVAPPAACCGTSTISRNAWGCCQSFPPRRRKMTLGRPLWALRWVPVWQTHVGHPRPHSQERNQEQQRCIYSAHRAANQQHWLRTAAYSRKRRFKVVSRASIMKSLR